MWPSFSIRQQYLPFRTDTKESPVWCQKFPGFGNLTNNGLSSMVMNGYLGSWRKVMDIKRNVESAVFEADGAWGVDGISEVASEL